MQHEKQTRRKSSLYIPHLGTGAISGGDGGGPQTPLLTFSKVDWAVVAQKAGYKDARTASTRYGQIMKKLTGVSAGKAMSGTSTTPSSPVAIKKTNGQAKKTIGSGTNGNASKVVKSRAPAAKKRKFEDSERDDEDESRHYGGFGGGYESYGNGLKVEEERDDYVDAYENAEG